MKKINFSTNLEKFRLQKKLSKSELARRLGVSDVTIGYWESGETEPKMRKVEEIANLLGITTDELIFETTSNESYIPARQQKTISRYKQMSLPNKEKIDDFVDFIYDNEFAIKEAPVIYEVQIPGATAAGSGILNGDISNDTCTVHQLPKSEFDYVLAVHGDSMEPLISDGSIVFVKKQDTLEHGEIGIFETENGVTCKKLYKDQGVVALHSLNSKYEPIIPKELRVEGKVVLD